MDLHHTTQQLLKSHWPRVVIKLHVDFPLCAYSYCEYLHSTSMTKYIFMKFPRLRGYPLANIWNYFFIQAFSSLLWITINPRYLEIISCIMSWKQPRLVTQKLLNISFKEETGDRFHQAVKSTKWRVLQKYLQFSTLILLQDSANLTSRDPTLSTFILLIYIRKLVRLWSKQTL